MAHGVDLRPISRVSVAHDSSIVGQVWNWWYIWTLRQPDQMRNVPVRFEDF